MTGMSSWLTMSGVSTTNHCKGSWLVMILTDNVSCDFPDCHVCQQGFVVLTQFRLDHAKNLGANWEKFPIICTNRQIKWLPHCTNFSGGIYDFFTTGSSTVGFEPRSMAWQAKSTTTPTEVQLDDNTILTYVPWLKISHVTCNTVTTVTTTLF